MNTHRLVGAVLVCSMAVAASAHAAPIAAGSTLSLNGNDTYTATSVTFQNPANIGAGSGSFSILGTPPQCVACATMTSFTAATATPFTLYTGHNLANTITTDLIVTSDTFSFTNGALPTLTVTGTGTLDLTGFDPTPGIFTLTTQGPTGTTMVTFSVTSMASPTGVPEPASLALLGAGLAGLGLFRTRRRKTA